MGSWTIDDAAWPILLVSTDGPQTDEQTEARLREMDRYIARGQPFAVLMVIRNYESSGRARGQRISAWFNERSGVLHERCAGMAVVYHQTFLRFLMSTMVMFIDQPIPYEVFDGEPKARTWLRARLEDLRARATPRQPLTGA